MKRLVIFDLDGTLVDSRATMEAAFLQAYAETVGQGDPPLEDFFGLLGESFPRILEVLDLPMAMWEPFRAASRARAGEIRLYPGLLRLCELLRRGGCRLAILTGKDRERTVELLDRLAVLHLFDTVVTSSDGLPAKPDPEAVLAICDRLAVPPELTVMVGDAAFDVLAGKRAGVRTVACGWGIGTPEGLREAGPDESVDSVADLERALDTWRAGSAGAPRSVVIGGGRAVGGGHE
ncbi:HAD family hydrolase [Streptomyces sp. OE57]|uniref:HAD family hydrolase n=1 Tax=Streptomyces lacaronensis TaxID=3379885 RepID=UPI0039B77B08